MEGGLETVAAGEGILQGFYLSGSTTSILRPQLSQIR